MDNIRKEIKEIKNRLGVIEPTLLMFDMNVNGVVRTQEYVEHRLDVNKNLEERIQLIEKYINTLHTYLNDTITRVNSIHMYLREERDDGVVAETDKETEQ